MNWILRPLLTCCLFFTIFSLAAFNGLCQNNNDYIKVTPTIRYKLLGTYDVNRLNTILNKEVPEAIEEKVNCSPAKNSVKLFRVEYSSVIPEQNNRVTVATGLVAIPMTDEKSFPMVSYQHGTIFGKYDVPSYPENSFETRLMLAQFGGQGYVVISADYFGLGDSKEKDSYIVLNSQTQASFDMYEAAKVVLMREGITTTNLFITGWSQGGVITMSFLEKLESAGVKVSAAGTACAQCDGYIMTNGFLQNPRKIDAPWVTTLFILTVFSFEEYYQMPGLAQGFFTANEYETAKRMYMKDTSLSYDEFPLDLHKLIRPEYFDAQYFKSSAYGKLISEMHPYRWVVKTPVHMYYGDVDECLTTGLAKLPMEYQKALGSNKIEAFSTGPDANHRKAYGRAVPEWKKWFDSFQSIK